jgi:hypothetical protein
MRVTLTIDPANTRDLAMRDEINGWLLYVPLRRAWTMTESEIEREADDNEKRVTLRFSFVDALDAHDFYAWRGIQGRGRLR